MAAALAMAAVLGFAATWLALRHVRPAWLRMRCVLGHWASFDVEMDGRVPRPRDVPPDERLKAERRDGGGSLGLRQW